MTGDLESSWNRGRIEVIAEGDFVSCCLLAWYAAQDLLLSPPRFPRSRVNILGIYKIVFESLDWLQYNTPLYTTVLGTVLIRLYTLNTLLSHGCSIS